MLKFPNANNTLRVGGPSQQVLSYTAICPREVRVGGSQGTSPEKMAVRVTTVLEGHRSPANERKIFKNPPARILTNTHRHGCLKFASGQPLRV